MLGCCCCFQLYSYAIFPIIRDISGCGPARQDAESSVVVKTVDCPTMGGVIMTITGLFFNAQGTAGASVFVGTTETVATVVPAANSANQSTLMFILPSGTGADLSVTVLISVTFVVACILLLNIRFVVHAHWCRLCYNPAKLPVNRCNTRCRMPLPPYIV